MHKERRKIVILAKLIEQMLDKRHRRERAKQSQRLWYLTKRKSRELTNLNYLRKDHYKDQIFEIRTSAVTEIKDFEQQREPCCYAIKTK